MMTVMYRPAPDKLAVVMADGRQLTYAELEDKSNRLAHWFRQVGLRPGDHIAFVLENRPEFFVVVWAAQRTGLYYTACSTQLNASELGYIIADCGARVLLASTSTADAADLAAPPGVERRLLVDSTASRPGWDAMEHEPRGNRERPSPTRPRGRPCSTAPVRQVCPKA